MRDFLTHIFGFSMILWGIFFFAIFIILLNKGKEFTDIEFCLVLIVTILSVGFGMFLFGINKIIELLEKEK